MVKGINAVDFYLKFCLLKDMELAFSSGSSAPPSSEESGEDTTSTFWRWSLAITNTVCVELLLLNVHVGKVLKGEDCYLNQFCSGIQRLHTHSQP